MAMALCGVSTGLLYDLLAVFRKNPFFTAAADLLLGLICACGVIAAGLALHCDPFRLYSLLGVGIGWMLYAVTVGIGVRALLDCFVRLSKKAVCWTKNREFMQENAETKRI